jgi:hypothetical protein
MTDEQNVKMEQQVTTGTDEPAPEESDIDAADESPYEIDEEMNSVATMVGTLGGLPEPEQRLVEDVQDTAVVTEVGALGWPEGAENEQNLGPDGQPADWSDANPSWTVEEANPT